eukprot:TRINITY_DN43636_c0_g1_i1.p1 TRINITY_DN43636_c0_g1~~TRINITY_DN43636_c0_g1_i1.p1  ORF type:complete len:912 (+),score=120.91 TRINITY_DN43636_c0_g1_i1:95-2830(+)
MSTLRELGFEDIKPIGRGQYGVVTLVRSLKDRSVCVCKTVDLTCRPEKERVASFREVVLLRRLHHPNVVQYLDHFAVGETIVLAMEYCADGDLAAYIRDAAKRRMRIRESVITGYLVQILLALQYVHGEHILHRDLKTSNLFLSDGGTTVKIGDFGISCVLEGSQNVAMSTVGTPHYMSPEVCENRPYTFKSDVWSVGCVIYELCVLKHAFSAGNLLGLVNKIVNEKLDPIPPVYSAGLNSLIQRMLAKSTNVRPSIHALLEDRHVFSFMHATFAPSTDGGGNSVGAEARLCGSSQRRERGYSSGESVRDIADPADAIMTAATSIVGNGGSGGVALRNHSPSSVGVRTMMRSGSRTSVGNGARSRAGSGPPSSMARKGNSLGSLAHAATATIASAVKEEQHEMSVPQIAQTPQLGQELRSSSKDVCGDPSPGPPVPPRPSRPQPPAVVARAPPRPVRPPPVRGPVVEDEHVSEEQDAVCDSQRRSGLVTRPVPLPLEELVDEFSTASERSEDRNNRKKRVFDEASDSMLRLSKLSEAWLSPEDVDGTGVKERRCNVSASHGRVPIQSMATVEDDGDEDEYEDDFCSDDSEPESVPIAAAARVLQAAVVGFVGARAATPVRTIRRSRPCSLSSSNELGNSLIGQDRPPSRRKLENANDRDCALATASRVRLTPTMEEDDASFPSGNRSGGATSANIASSSWDHCASPTSLPGALDPSDACAFNASGSDVTANVASAPGLAGSVATGDGGALAGYVSCSGDRHTSGTATVVAACGTSSNTTSHSTLVTAVGDGGGSNDTNGCVVAANVIGGGGSSVGGSGAPPQRHGRCGSVMAAVASFRRVGRSPLASGASGPFASTSGQKESPKKQAATTGSNSCHTSAHKVQAQTKLSQTPGGTIAGARATKGRGTRPRK